MARAALLCLLAGGALATPGVAAAAPKLVKLGDFTEPTYLTSAPGDTRRLFVVERPGTIRVVRDGRKLRRPFLDLRRRVLSGGERGLLSVAFHPAYGRNRLLYVYYTDRRGDIRIEEFKRGRTPDRARVLSRRLVLEVTHREFANHNGGQLQFGPDRMLYIGTGDGGGGGDSLRNGQDITSLLGKLLRIDPRRPRSSRAGARRAESRRYRIPSGNPFSGRPGRSEIWAYGLRNPWRFSFDRPRARRIRSLGLRVGGLSSFGESTAGCVYAVSLSGAIHRIAPSSQASASC